MFPGQNLVQINDFPEVITKIYSYISVSVRSVVLNTSVDIQVMLFDINKNYSDMKTVTLTGTEYTSWGSDDTYILNMACQKLGFTLATTPATVPDPTNPLVPINPLDPII
jgi:hypothetical protein